MQITLNAPIPTPSFEPSEYGPRLIITAEIIAFAAIALPVIKAKYRAAQTLEVAAFRASVNALSWQTGNGPNLHMDSCVLQCAMMQLQSLREGRHPPSFWGQITQEEWRIIVKCVA